MILGNEIERRYFSIVPSYMYYDCLSSDCLLGGIDQFNRVFIHNLFGLRRITIGDETINTTVNRCYVFYPLYPYIHFHLPLQLNFISKYFLKTGFLEVN